MAAKLQHEGVFATVSTEQPLAAGKYAGPRLRSEPRRAVGPYKMTQQGKSYAFSRSSPPTPVGLPCWDEPLFKIPFQITEIPAAGAGDRQRRCSAKSPPAYAGWKTLEFGITRPLPSYLLAIAVGPLRFTPSPDSGPGRVTPSGQQKLTGWRSS